MIYKKNITRIICGLESKYNQSMASADPDGPILYSKLAVLECCGWIEESMDLIAVRPLKGKLKTTTFEDMKRGAVEQNHGFAYKQNFRPMFQKCVGLFVTECLERKLASNGDLTTLEDTLASLKKERDKAAHTWTNGPLSYPAPSVTLTYVDRVFPILRKMYSFSANVKI